MENDRTGAPPVNAHGGAYQPASGNESSGPVNPHGGGYIPEKNGDMNINTNSSETVQNGTPSSLPRKSAAIRGYCHLLDLNNKFRWFISPHFYRPSHSQYASIRAFRHRDAMERITVHPIDDRFIDPFNGGCQTLTVQAVDEIYCQEDQDAPSNKDVTWDRTFLRSACPLHVILANWPGSHFREDVTEDINPPNKNKMARMFGLAVLKHFISSICLAPLMIFPFSGEGETRNHGRYDAVQYRLERYAKLHSNHYEHREAIKYEERRPWEARMLKNHLLHPKKLRLVKPPPFPTPAYDSTTKLLDVDMWLEENPDRTPEYVFISFTTDHLKRTKPEIFLEQADKIAEMEGFEAYWISLCCVTSSPGDVHGPDKNFREDVYRMSDVIRRARSVAILVCPEQGEKYTDQLLKEWGKRVWTFPEVLLYHFEAPIKVYTLGQEDYVEVYRNSIAERAWSDAPYSRQLIDYFAGSLDLSRLELSTMALKCFHNREVGKYLDGDMAYALMGLLSVRPEVDITDTDFQAFARLSLANDSDRLLERLVCMLPKPGQYWYNLEDEYGSNLWDIAPTCQVAGIGGDGNMIIINNEFILLDGDEVKLGDRWVRVDGNHIKLVDPTSNTAPRAKVNAVNEIKLGDTITISREDSAFNVSSLVVYRDNTVIIDGALAANIQWHTFSPVRVERPRTWGRLVIKLALHSASVILILGAILLYVQHHITRQIDEVAADFPGLSSVPTSSVVPSTSPSLTKRESAMPTTSSTSAPSLGQATTFVSSVVGLVLHLQVMQAFGIVFIVWSVLVILAAPWLIRRLYGGKFANPQPWLFGFEGYLPIDQIETLIFGNYKRRLRWHPFGSTLSKHEANEYGDCVGQDPFEFYQQRENIETKSGDLKLFTLVDTYTRTVTLFEAMRPPVVLLLLGTEGGMQRALGCSYDWKTKTFFRETVLRMETPVRERMDGVSRVKIGLQKREDTIKPRNENRSRSEEEA